MQTTPPLTEIAAVCIKQPVNFVGKFNVINSSGVRKFTILDLAIKYYNELNEEAALWDVSDGIVLLKFKCVLKNNGHSGH